MIERERERERERDPFTFILEGYSFKKHSICGEGNAGTKMPVFLKSQKEKKNS
jgi:hypothetical protein